MAAHRTEALVDVLRRRIVEGTIAAGEKLPSENTLIAEHGVSRTVVREALTALRADGLVRTRRGAGSYALTPPSPPGSTWPARPVRTLAERRALLELRTGVECEAAGLAASRRSEADLAALRHAQKALEASLAEPAAALEHDFAVHRGIAVASGNPYLLELLDALGPTMIAMPRDRLTAHAGSGAGDAVVQEHAAVLEALEAGEPRAAAAAMRMHLDGTRRRLAQNAEPRDRTG
ncbi:FadR/GntR family transcriptional regulator [Brachybacterium saurashtrense]|uniref:FadR family transcriptional regulator n=1 Tax=Brachybacterium saurashtrense TaxID=556288 RepID=A0A345YMS5_9MICO|nr:FadR/GntR family transcriptional regulator [Brachybacterium saurashtrense]AXK45227.1 FadR family transcriptional regulator [Brachybacterium saurashtrense]RRR22019.1 FadR family transcriptional regulator [Brachybacterium saurashtrense]